MYSLEFKTNIITINDLIQTYCFADRFMEFCKGCSEYNAVWSCPPLNIDPLAYLKEYEHALIIGAKIIYSPDFIEEAKAVPEEAQAAYYEASENVVKALLHTEYDFQSIKAIAPGSCRICVPCERAFARKCKYPDKMRYSFDSFGMDLTKIAQALLGTELLWEKSGLPEYHMLISAFLIKDSGDISVYSEFLINEFIKNMGQK